MNTTITKPSFNTCYYIRKQLLEYENELQAIVKPKSGFCFNSQVILEELLYSVYLEETLENIFQKLYKKSLINAKIEQLEDLVTQHQNVTNKPDSYEETVKLKRQIFVILGFKTIVVSVSDVLNALNQLSQFGKECLGATITTNNWQNTRSDLQGMNSFQIERSAKITYAGQSTEIVSFEQLQLFQTWVNLFIKRSSSIIRDFATSIEEQKIGKLPSGVLITSVDSYSDWSNVDA